MVVSAEWTLGSTASPRNDKSDVELQVEYDLYRLEVSQDLQAASSL